MALLSTGRQLYGKLDNLPHSANRWLLEDMTCLLHHLSPTPTKFRTTMKDITLKAGDWTPVEQQLDAIKQCSNLQRLRIKMPDTQYDSLLAQVNTFNLSHNLSETIQDVLRATRLERLILEWHLKRCCHRLDAPAIEAKVSIAPAKDGLLDLIGPNTPGRGVLCRDMG